MDQSLIDKIKSMTGQEDQAITDFLSTLSIDQMYLLIDSNRRADDATMLSVIKPLMTKEDEVAKVEPNEVEEAMKDKNKITVDLPKQRDHMAKALALGQYQPKSTPNKKEKIARQERKHKGLDPFVAEDQAGDFLEEGVMSMTAMPAIKKMLSLAGRPIDEDAIEKAMEDFMGDFGDFAGLSINDLATPVGTTIPAGPLDSVMATPDDEGQEQDAFDSETDAMAMGMANQAGMTQAYMSIRAAVEQIKTQLHDIKFTEYAQVKALVGELNSVLDKLGNSVK